MRNNQLQQILNDLNGSTADIEASALISTDGLMMASALPQGMDEDRVGAMTAALLSLGVTALPKNWHVGHCNASCCKVNVAL